MNDLQPFRMQEKQNHPKSPLVKFEQKKAGSYGPASIKNIVKH